MKIFKSKLVILFLLTILSIIPLFPLFHPGLPITHDGQDHVVRIANFYQNLTEGNIIPRWAGNLNWGYGHPILEFLYPLPSYVASLFHFLGFSFIDSTKIVFGLGMVLSGTFMFLWLSEFLGLEAGIFGAILYMFTPYRFVEIYVRGDIGENLAFAFIPLVLYFILKLSKKIKKRYVIGGGISIAFLILSHNAISLMSMPLVFLYIVYLLCQINSKKFFILNSLYLILLGFGLSAFFWIPGLFEGKYTLRNILTSGEYLNRFVNLKSLIYGPWSYGGTGQFTVQLGIVNWAILLFSIVVAYYAYLRKKKIYLLIVVLLLYSLVGIFLMLKESQFIWQRIILLQNFQFPWRFLAVPLLTSPILGGILIFVTPKKIKLVYFVLMIALVFFLNKNYWHANGYLQKEDSFFEGVYAGTTDTGESSPIWSVRFMEKRPKAHLEVIDGDAKIKELDRKSAYHKYQVQVNKNTLFGENTLYFPGWEIKANGKLLNIEFQNMQYRGIMTFNLTKGSYVVEAEYKETKLRLVSDIISFAALFVAVFLLLFKFVKPKLS